MSYLNSYKQDTLVSGTNIKTINGSSILGSGNLVVTGSGASWGSITGTLSSQTDLQTALNAKQDDITLTTTGSSGASTFISNTLNVPDYTLTGLGGVPTTRTLTINGSTQDLSANRTFTINPVSGTIVLIYTDETETTGTTATTAKTYTLAANTYSKIMIEAEIEFINTANLNGNANFNIVVGGVTKRTLTLSGDATGTGDQFQSGGTCKYSEAITGGAVIDVTTTTVANASWVVFSLRVYGVY